MPDGDRPDFVIHIGPHKTGSTYLQASLAQHAKALLRRGVLYPTDLGHPGQTRLPRLIEQADGQAMADRVAAYRASDCRTVVLSSEDLAPVDEADVMRFARSLQDHVVQVVFYCRAWADVALSQWNQQVRTGHATPLDEAMQFRMERPRMSAPINYGRALGRWAAAFGHTALRLVSLESLAAAGQDSFAHFTAAFLGVTDLRPRTRIRRNASVPLIEAEIIRALNRMRIDRAGERDSELARCFLAERSGLALSTTIAAAERCRDTLVFDETDPRLQRLHNRLFQDFGDRLVHPAPNGQFFTPRRRELATIRADYLTQPGVAAELEAVYARLLPCWAT